MHNYPDGERGKFEDEPYTSPTLPSRYYTDSDIYQREISSIFHGSWCYVGHQSAIPNPGDYFVEHIADQCLFVIRVDDATIHAYYNVCQHRGHELLEGSGSVKRRIVCPYHAWAYDLNGDLLKAPRTENLENFDASKFGLKSIGLSNCAGLLFANLQQTSEDFTRDYAELETTIFDHLPNAAEFTIASTLKYNIEANWKVVVDNFSEGYHIPIAHPKLSKVLDTVENKNSIVRDNFSCFKSVSKSGYPGLDLEPGKPYLSWTIWPNTCMLSQPGCENLIVIRMAPDGKDRCAERVDILAPYDNGSTHLEALKALFVDGFNKEDIAIVESVQRGLASLGYDQGRYVTDRDEKWYSESGLHRFHKRIVNALDNSGQ